MSKYTTEVRFICEERAGLLESVGENDVNNVLDLSWNKIFDSTFPIFDEAYRKPLCKKILKHFYTREICCETFGLWKMWLNEKMELIMPYYNQLYRSELLEINPFYNFDYTKTGGEIKASDTAVNEIRGGTLNEGIMSEVNDRSNNWNVYSDTPQGSLQNLENGTYMTDARNISETDITNNESSMFRNTSNSKTNVTDFDTTSEYTEHVIGMRGVVSVPRILDEYRKTFLNIDNMIIEELNDLFFKLW